MEPGGRSEDTSRVFAQGGVKVGYDDACGQVVVVALEPQAVAAHDDARGAAGHEEHDVGHPAGAQLFQHLGPPLGHVLEGRVHVHTLALGAVPLGSQRVHRRVAGRRVKGGDALAPHLLQEPVDAVGRARELVGQVRVHYLLLAVLEPDLLPRPVDVVLHMVFFCAGFDSGASPHPSPGT